MLGSMAFATATMLDTPTESTRSDVMLPVYLQQRCSTQSLPLVKAAQGGHGVGWHA